MTEVSTRVDPAHLALPVPRTSTDEASEVRVVPSLQTSQARSAWPSQYAGALALLDAGIIVASVGLGYLLRFGTLYPDSRSVSYPLVGLLVALGWLAMLQAGGAYEIRHMSVGAEEFKRVIRASLLLAGVTAAVCYVAALDVARGFVAGVIPIGMCLLVLGRWLSRKTVVARRKNGEWSYRIVAVGSRDSVNHLIETSHRQSSSGLIVIGACLDDSDLRTPLACNVPVVGLATDAARLAEELDADVVALAGSSLAPYRIRELGWQLEGTGRELVMAPGLTDVAGPRVHVSPVEGLPLMWVDQPQFTGAARLVKRAMDLLGSLVVLVLASPVLIAVALGVKATSRGPVFFKQQRTGQHSTDFEVFKFRSMYVDAEARRADLMDQNENDGALFKMRRDPRVTPIGRLIRRLSLDELPQIINVLRGEMSLVGPRPLASIDSGYVGNARRRLLVRPGMTGLWQVSGRSDLSWDDAVRLDLYYVEN
ncbi:MAG: exopolysaccharide biosynthesis polyprenyl glycosylphosphotransferase, partial [Pseudonocardiales bacterium]|nr:exopolysaccharide biosynthesis polyprenyl glycosylphosphotransferase [Pseudonocardiales bacterium]